MWTIPLKEVCIIYMYFYLFFINILELQLHNYNYNDTCIQSPTYGSYFDGVSSSGW